MKNILSKVKFHPLLFICLLVFILIGRFKFILYFMIIILFHEMGHITLAIIFKWNIDEIIILPFGGLIKFKEKIDKPLYEEFIIAISGVVFQTLFYLITKESITYEYFSFINYFILCFNLIPIYPLDGYKILNIIFNKLFTFKKSLELSIIISCIVLLFIIIISIHINLLLILALIFLIKEIIIINKNKKYIFNKFLLERYLYNFNFSKKRIINNVYNVKRNYNHIFYVNNKCYNEKEYLKKYFIN